MGLFSHRRCETLETVLRTVIDDQRAEIEDLKQRHREDIERLENDRKELLDRLLLYANPNAASYYDRFQRREIKKEDLHPPTPTPEQDARMKARERANTPAPRRPYLSPDDAGFLRPRVKTAPAPDQPGQTVTTPRPAGEFDSIRERHVSDGAIAGPLIAPQAILADDPLSAELPTTEIFHRE